MLNKIQLWQEIAENRAFSTQCLPVGPTQASLTPVAGPSNNFLAANCQNRYPSPSKRSDHSLIRPLNLFRGRQRIAQIFQNCKKTFAFGFQNWAIGGTEYTQKGKRACKRNFGQWLLQPLLHFRPVAKRHWSKDLWAPEPERQPLSFLVAMLQRVRLLVARLTCCIASKTHRSAKIVILSGALRLRKSNERPSEDNSDGRFFMLKWQVSPFLDVKGNSYV